MTPSDTLALLLREQERLFETGYLIAYWPWELEHWPPELAMALDLVDELWVSTQFVRRTLELVSPVPVVYMPMAVALPAVQQASRSDFGLTEDAFLFLMVFDGHSTISRKNPLAGVRAFRSAFPAGREPVRLIIKTMNVEADDPRWREVLSAAGGDPRVVVFNEMFSREALVGLIQVCDCFVSPHRSEGYGRALAEALLLEKPVIATAYGGNMDFTNRETAYLVDYVMAPVQLGEFPFATGVHWAEPSVGSVVRQMRAVAADRAGREATARRGAALIRQTHSLKTVGARYVQRIDRILQFAKLSG
jgi:glycosyltransferase involved in cell wall biosynthesis